MPNVRSMARDLMKRILRRLDYRITRVDNPELLETVLYRILLGKGHLTFVQIGANDGVRFDPIRAFVKANRHRITGVVVEPLPDLFEALRRNYRDCPSVVAVNAAIHNEKRKATLYRVDPRRAAGLPDWVHGIASFDRKHLAQHSIIPSEAVVGVEVPCLRFDELLKGHGITELDFLLIDTEGYDAEIIGSLDFRQARPRTLRFEHGCGAGIMDRTTFEAVLQQLHAAGYEVLVELEDATAYDRYLFIEPWQSRDLPDDPKRQRGLA
jgi:FkbM family methyltransferase